MDRTEVLIVGAGLAGLSATLHLRRPYLLLEKEDEPGGVCRSVRCGGSTYDYTGHLLHLRRPQMRELVDEILPGRMAERERRAAIFSHGRFVPYPFQANFHPLPREVVRECLLGFVRAQEEQKADPRTFREWALATFGEGICRHFMFPYNEKLHCRGLDEMTADWVSWSVPRPDLETVVDGALGTTTEGLGYNPSFLYPKEGGIEALPRALAERVENLETGQEVVRIDAGRRVAETAAGREIGYDHLVSTMPLPTLLEKLDGGHPRASEWAAGLRWVNVFNLNITLDREAPWPWQWLYLPEPEFRCYRIGIASNFSPALAPPGCCAIYTEVSYRPEEKPDEEELRERILGDLRLLGLLQDAVEVKNEVALRIEPAYVIHDRFRADNLEAIHARLRESSILSIGRWGSWEYSGMEDALWQGREAASLLDGN